jgi:threonine aldolase
MDGAKIWYASKTMLFGLATALTPMALQYLGGVDWTQFGISPAAGIAIGAVVMGLRGFTSSPV